MLKLPSIRQAIGNSLFFMLILVIMLDPTNSVLHLKDVFFVLLVGFNMVAFRPDFSYIPHILTVLFTVTLCYIIGVVQGSDIDYDELLAIYKAFSPLFLLLWIRHYDVIKLSMVPAIITCLTLSVLYILASSSTIVEAAIWTFAKEHDNMIMMSRRYILGFRIFGMYYKSLVCLMFAMFTYFYDFMNKPKYRILRFIPVIIITWAFLVSGTRSSMLLPFFMGGFVAYKSLGGLRKARYIFYPVLACFCLAFILFILVLATETTESSNAIKYAHLSSYAEHFDSHPWYLLVGQGPATSFFTEGFGRYTLKTEWTYVELVRYYGLFSLLIFAVVVSPAVRMFKHIKTDTYTFGIFGTYIAYLFIAGTNPLLISSTGMLVILSANSYVEKLKRVKIEKIEK